MSKDTRRNLEQNLNEVRSVLIRMADLYFVCIDGYSRAMSENLNQVEYFEKYDLIQTHQSKKTIAMDQVCFMFESTHNFNVNNGAFFILPKNNKSLKKN